MARHVAVAISGILELTVAMETWPANQHRVRWEKNALRSFGRSVKVRKPLTEDLHLIMMRRPLSGLLPSI